MASNRHEGVSCDACMRSNFSGRRFKCLMCFDFDLCSECYESGHVGRDQHSSDHPVQCILTRQDFEMYYGGEAVSPDQPQSLSCPFCRQMGLTEVALHEHVVSEHAHIAVDVACPVCAAQPPSNMGDRDTNRMTEDLAAHLSMYHLSRRDTTHEEGRAPRRLPPSSVGRGVARGAPRGRHTANLSNNAELAAAATGFGALAAANPTSTDPIAELMRQLGGIRRSNGAGYSSTLAHIQHLHQQFGRVNLAARRGRWGAAPVTEGRRAINAPAPEALTYSQVLSSGRGPSLDEQIFEMANGRPGSNQPTMIFLGDRPTNTPKTPFAATPMPSAATSSGDDAQPLLKRLFEASHANTENAEDAATRRNFTQELLLSSLRQEPCSEILNRPFNRNDSYDHALRAAATLKAEYEAAGARPKAARSAKKNKRQAVVAPSVQSKPTPNNNCINNMPPGVSVNVGFMTPHQSWNATATSRPVAQVPPSTLSVAVQSSAPVTAQITASVTVAPIARAETYTNSTRN